MMMQLEQGPPPLSLSSLISATDPNLFLQHYHCQHNTLIILTNPNAIQNDINILAVLIRTQPIVINPKLPMRSLEDLNLALNYDLI